MKVDSPDLVCAYVSDIYMRMHILANQVYNLHIIYMKVINLVC